jgi:glycosyltransferase involved in cell wall biosynthesis
MSSVDVVIPSYNYARFLPQCVASVLSQEVADLRVIIIDNASTDGSVDVARHMAKDDSRIEVVCHGQNLGPQASFNEAIDLARADYFTILCADDVLTEGSLRQAVGILDRSPEATFALGAEAKTWAEGSFDAVMGSTGWSVSNGNDFIERCCGCLGFGWGLGAVLVRSSAQKKVGHYRASLPYTDDLEMVLRLARTGSVLELEGALCVRREHGSQMSNSRFSNEYVRLREREAAFDSFFDTEGRGLVQVDRLRKVARKKLAEAAFRASASHLSKGLVPSGASLLKYAFSRNPAALFPALRQLARRRDAFGKIGAAGAGYFRQWKQPA